MTSEIRVDAIGPVHARGLKSAFDFRKFFRNIILLAASIKFGSRVIALPPHTLSSLLCVDGIAFALKALTYLEVAQ